MSEKERIHQTGVGTRTFERIRQRAYRESWLFDRLVPNPSRTGIETVYVVLSRPYIEEIQGLQERWSSHSSTVLLWRWPDAILSIFFVSPSLARNGDVKNVLEFGPEDLVLACTPDGGGIPVYIDFEASWSRRTALPGTISYPQGLAPVTKGRPAVNGEGLTSSPSFANFLSRAITPSGLNLPVRTGRFSISRSERRWLESGLVQVRTFLDPARIPLVGGRRDEGVAILEGELVNPASEVGLLRLMLAMKVTPFLYASDGKRILAGTLYPAPFEELQDRPRIAVLRTLQQYLRGIRILREPFSGLTVVTNHRYEGPYG
jgi:hypothetical protein